MVMCKYCSLKCIASDCECRCHEEGHSLDYETMKENEVSSHK